MTQDTAPLEGDEISYSGTASGAGHRDTDWLGLAREAYDASTSFLNANYRHRFEKNLANFKSLHPPGSKYHSEAYKTRSRLFRPKTRTAIRKNEAALAAALFSAQDVVVIEAEDMDDQQKRRDAAFWHEVINYRLDKTIPWFQTVVGAFQEAQVYGVVCSKQYWEYEAVDSDEKSMVPDPVNTNLPALDNDGDPIFRPETDVVKDRPCVRLIEIENIRFDPACDWIDPVNSSPYIIEIMPMYVGAVLDRMELVDEKTNAPQWKKLDPAQIIAMGKGQEQSDDTTRRGRHAGANVEADHHISEFETVWVHENIVRVGGQDFVYYTLSTLFLLSEPVPLKEVYEHGIRPFVLGCAVIEAHRPIPSGTVELGESLQAEANDTVNQRLDNVKLALNKRYFAKRDSGTDLNALLRNVPGGIVLTNDVNSVKEQEVRDVTGSSYQEQTRLDTDFDEIMGVFSSSSVQNNRAMNETVGGMELMSQSAGKDTEYLIRTFVETWVEPVLRQIVLLEQFYEDDEHIYDIALKAVRKEDDKALKQQALEQGQGQPTGQELDPLQQQGQEQGAAVPPPVDELPLEKPQNIDVKVHVGFGNINPDQRIKKVVSGLEIMARLAPWALANINAEEVAQEIFGALGHKNGQRFFNSLTPPPPQSPPEIQLKEAELQATAQYNQAKLAQDRELKMMELALRERVTMAQLQNSLGIDEKWMAQERELAGARNLTVLAGVEHKERELEFKATTGRSGI